MRAFLMCLGVLAVQGVSGQASDSIWPPGADPATQPPGQDMVNGGPGDLSVYTDLAGFLAAVGGAAAVTVEDFEGGFAGPAAVKVCFEALSVDSDDPCFVPGDLETGFAMRASRGSVSFDGVVALGSAIIGAGSTVVGANAIDPPANATRINFDPPVTAVAMDVYDGQLGQPVTVMAHAADDSVIGSLTVEPPATSDPAFAGFTSPVPIEYVEINGTVDGAGELVDNLHFGGGPGRLVSQPGSLAFGEIGAGDETATSLTLTNTGGLDLDIGALPALSPPFAITADTCSGATLVPDGDCSVSVAFAPDYAGSFGAVLDIPAGDASLAVPVSGHGVVARLIAAPGGIDFGTIATGTSSGPETITLMNRQAGEVGVSGLSITTAAFALAGGSCPAVPFELAPGMSCTLEVTFTPDAEGDHQGRLLAISDGEPAEVDVALAGEGAGQAVAQTGEIE